MGVPERWIRGPERILAATRVFEVRAVSYRHEGRAADREFAVIAAPDWVNVLALTPDDRLVLVRQFRYGIDEFSLEIPGGVMNPGEDPVTAGLRELREETGYTGLRGRLLGAVRPNPAIQNNRAYFVLVEDAIKTHALEWDHDEEIETSTVPAESVLAWARSGRITHSLVVAALFHFEGWYRAGRPPPGALI
jgi:8-oxo-dGTP pyrophosphatase MutT (NUDIX family)